MTEPDGATPVVIVGAGVLGRMLRDCLQGDPRWRCLGFIDDGEAGNFVGDLPVHGVDDGGDYAGGAAFMAVGFPATRRALVARCAPLRLDWRTYVDRRSMVADGAKVGLGTLVLPFAMVVSDGEIGEFGYVSSYASLGAGASVGAYTSLMAGAAVGGVRVGSDCVLGLNSACIDGARLEDGVTVAPFTLFRGSAAAGALVAGAPGRARLRSRAAE